MCHEFNLSSRNGVRKKCFCNIAGWVREVIYERNIDGSLCGKAKEVVYHAPMMPGAKRKIFKSQAELRPYRKLFLNTKGRVSKVVADHDDLLTH